MNKRGLSGVVTVVLIIMISVIAVLILWVLVRGLLDKSSEEMSANFIGVDVDIVNVELIGDELKVTVKRGAGGGNIDKIKIVARNNEDSMLFSSNSGISVLESKTYNFELYISNPIKIEVYPVILIKGKEKIGHVLDEKDISIQYTPTNLNIGGEGMIQCNEWGECEAEYDFEDIIDETVIIEGVSRRECSRGDNSVIQKKDCALDTPVESRVVEYCGERYVEIFDLEGNLLARIRKDGAVLDILFTSDLGVEC